MKKTNYVPFGESRLGEARGQPLRLGWKLLTAFDQERMGKAGQRAARIQRTLVPRASGKPALALLRPIGNRQEIDLSHSVCRLRWSDR